jgi:hypothetical protein
MEDKLFRSWEDSAEDDKKLVKEAFENPGKPVITLDQITNMIPFVEHQNGKRYRPTMHIGQRKLFLNELQFLNKYVNQVPIMYT